MSALLALGCSEVLEHRDGEVEHGGPTVLPAEYEPVAEAIFAWDTDPNLETFFAELVTLASGSAPVTILLSPDESADWVKAVARDFGADMSKIRLFDSGVESVWVRDYGPLVVREGGKRHVVDFKYFGDEGDDQAPRFLAQKKWSLPRAEFGLEIEGGNILSDGAGLCLTTEAVVTANGMRLNIDEIREVLKISLGCRELMILRPLAGEPTGHVDMFATLTGPGEAIVGEIFEDDQENAEILDENARALEAAGLRVRRVPMPAHEDGRFRSYTNALAINDIVIVPVYPEADHYEELALATFAEAYPDRKVLPIIASEIIEKSGAVHCVGMTVAQ